MHLQIKKKTADMAANNGKIALTQKQWKLLTPAKPGFVTAYN